MSVQIEKTAATAVHITEPSLSVFFDANHSLTDAILDQHGESFPQWEASFKSLEEFEVRIRNRGSDLQHERVVTPEKLALEAERDKFLVEYWEYKETCAAVEQFGLNLLKTVDYLAPRVHSFDSAPQLSLQIKAVDEISLTQMSKLKEAYTHVNELHEKMTTFISSKTNWSVQRFCQIVDNNGKPISWKTRLIDNMTTPYVPPISASISSESSESPIAAKIRYGSTESESL